MGAIKNYPIDFPKRTLELIDSFNKREINYRLDVTLLMNCLLGLIVIAVETSKREKLMPGKVDAGLLKLLPYKL